MTTTSEAPLSKTKQEIIKEAKRVEESALYSSKGHLVAARVWSNCHLGIGLVTVVGTAFAAALAMSNVDQGHTGAGLLYVGVAVASAILTFLNGNERAGTHLNAGNHFESLRNRARMFWTIECWQEGGDAELSAKLQALESEKARLNLSSPQIPYWSYKIAKRQINAGEALFKVDGE